MRNRSVRPTLHALRSTLHAPRLTLNALRTTLHGLRLFIDSLEVLEDRAALIGGQAAQLVPVRLAELRAVLAGRVGVRRRELLVPLRRFRFALVAVLALILLERTARVEETPEELLLPGERRTVDASSLERFGELTRFLRELRRPIATGAFAHFVELQRDAPLLPRQGPCRRLHLGRHLTTRHRHEALRLGVDRALLLRHFLQLLQHLCKAGRGRRGVDPFSVPRQRGRGTVQRLGGLA